MEADGAKTVRPATLTHAPMLHGLVNASTNPFSQQTGLSSLLHSSMLQHGQQFAFALPHHQMQSQHLQQQHRIQASRSLNLPSLDSHGTLLGRRLSLESLLRQQQQQQPHQLQSPSPSAGLALPRSQQQQHQLFLPPQPSNMFPNHREGINDQVYRLIQQRQQESQMQNLLGQQLVAQRLQLQRERTQLLFRQMQSTTTTTNTAANQADNALGLPQQMQQSSTFRLLESLVSPRREENKNDQGEEDT